MNINEIRLSVSQIQKMKHALGLNHPTNSKMKLVVNRNFYATDDDPEWNELVERGLASKRSDPFCKGDIVYHVSEEGLDYLSRIMCKTITISK